MNLMTKQHQAWKFPLSMGEMKRRFRAAFGDQKGVFGMTTQGQSTVFNGFGPTTVSGIIPPLQLADMGAAGATGAAGGAGFTSARTVSAVFSLAFAATKFQVVIWLKTYTTGTTAVTGGGPIVGPIFSLEGADVVGMSTNLMVIGNFCQAINIATATYTGGQLMTIQGFTPVAPKQFLRLAVDPTLQTGAVAGVFDAVIMAEP